MSRHPLSPSPLLLPPSPSLLSTLPKLPFASAPKASKAHWFFLHSIYHPDDIRILILLILLRLIPILILILIILIIFILRILILSFAVLAAAQEGWLNKEIFNIQDRRAKF